MAIYIIGMMLYKFGLEAFSGSIITLATNRYDNDAKISHTTPQTFFKVGLLTGLNQAFQCIGSILIAPLIKHWPTKLVLSVAIFVFGLFSAILLIVDAGTGGKIKPLHWNNTHPSDDWSYYGKYNTNGIIPIYCVAGIAYGMVELIRRIIPRDIVGGDIQKLRRMNAIVEIFYEIAGTYVTSSWLYSILGLSLELRLQVEQTHVNSMLPFSKTVTYLYQSYADLDLLHQRRSFLHGSSTNSTTWEQHGLYHYTNLLHPRLHHLVLHIVPQFQKASSITNVRKTSIHQSPWRLLPLRRVSLRRS